MRLNFVFTLLVFMALVLGGIILIKHRTGNVPKTVEATPPLATSSVSPLPATIPTKVPVATTAVITPEDRQATIDTEENRLSAWQMNNDPASLSNILSDLSSPEKDIQMAAIEAAKQFGSTNAIPALKAAVDATDDTEEKIALLKAADFLSLPKVVWQNNDPNAPQTPEQIQQAARMKAINDAQQQVHTLSSSQNGNRQPGAPAAPGQ